MKMYEYQRNNSMYLFLIYLTEFQKEINLHKKKLMKLNRY